MAKSTDTEKRERAKRLADLRRAAGFTQDQLVASMGNRLDRKYLSKIENGHNQAQTLLVIDAYALGFRLSRDEIVAVLDGALEVNEAARRSKRARGVVETEPTAATGTEG